MKESETAAPGVERPGQDFYQIYGAQDFFGKKPKNGRKKALFSRILEAICPLFKTSDAIIPEWATLRRVSRILFRTIPQLSGGSNNGGRR